MDHTSDIWCTLFEKCDKNCFNEAVILIIKWCTSEIHTKLNIEQTIQNRSPQTRKINWNCNKITFKNLEFTIALIFSKVILQFSSAVVKPNKIWGRRYVYMAHKPHIIFSSSMFHWHRIGQSICSLVNKNTN